VDHHQVSLLKDIGLGIFFSAAASHVARLLKQPLILGYVLGGALLGTQLGFGLVTNAESVHLISEIGLIFLLFIIGLEIDLRELAKMGRTMAVIGFVQFAGCVGLGMLLLKPLGFGLGAGNFDLLYLAVALALSSTLIVVKLLADKFETTTVAGRLTIGILVLQDLWAIAFMAFQPNLLSPQLGSILRSVGQGAVLVAAAFLVSRHVLTRLYQAAGKNPELVLLTSTAWCFLICGLAQEAGLSKEMGALIAGMSIAAFPYGVDVVSKIGGIRDFFVTLFFVALGLQVPRPTGSVLALSALLVAFVFVSRVLTVALTARFLGMGLRTGLVSAANLSQISEFSLVILALGAGYKHIGPDLQALVLTAMLLASVASTYMILLNDRIARGIMSLLMRVGLKELCATEAKGHDHQGRDIVLLGCFRAGEVLVDEIHRRAPELKSRVLVIDYNPAIRARLEARGFHWVYGDLAHPETLKHLGISNASVVVCSVPDVFLKGTSNLKLLNHLKKLAPRARWIMTADEPAAAKALVEAGAHEAVTPAELAGGRFYELLCGAASA
jgi:Kef-type K+ transport system membrane component KefB